MSLIWKNNGNLMNYLAVLHILGPAASNSNQLQLNQNPNTSFLCLDKISIN